MNKENKTIIEQSWCLAHCNRLIILESMDKSTKVNSKITLHPIEWHCSKRNNNLERKTPRKHGEVIIQP